MARARPQDPVKLVRRRIVKLAEGDHTSLLWFAWACAISVSHLTEGDPDVAAGLAAVYDWAVGTEYKAARLLSLRTAVGQRTEALVRGSPRMPIFTRRTPDGIPVACAALRARAMTRAFNSAGSAMAAAHLAQDMVENRTPEVTVEQAREGLVEFVADAYYAAADAIGHAHAARGRSVDVFSAVDGLVQLPWTGRALWGLLEVLWRNMNQIVVDPRYTPLVQLAQRHSKDARLQAVVTTADVAARRDGYAVAWDRYEMWTRPRAGGLDHALRRAWLMGVDGPTWLLDPLARAVVERTTDAEVVEVARMIRGGAR